MSPMALCFCIANPELFEVSYGFADLEVVDVSYMHGLCFCIANPELLEVSYGFADLEVVDVSLACMAYASALRTQSSGKCPMALQTWRCLVSPMHGLCFAVRTQSCLKCPMALQTWRCTCLMSPMHGLCFCIANLEFIDVSYSMAYATSIMACRPAMEELDVSYGFCIELEVFDVSYMHALCFCTGGV